VAKPQPVELRIFRTKTPMPAAKFGQMSSTERFVSEGVINVNQSANGELPMLKHLGHGGMPILNGEKRA
jgi:hypothetical protein